MRPFWANWNIPQSFGECISYAQQILFLAKKDAENEEDIEKLKNEVLPEGGTTNQILRKKSDADYDTEWVSPGGGGTALTPVIDADATVDDQVGTPEVNVTKTGTDENPRFHFAFHNVKGEPGANGEPGQDGAPGHDGYSPVVTVEDIREYGAVVGHRVTITDAEHPSGIQFEVMNGVDGTPGVDGYSPVVTVDDITDSETGTVLGHAVTITDEEHPDGQRFEVMNGAPGSDGAPGQDGVGVPAGGNAGQVLAKASGSDYDTEWVTPQSGGGGSNPVYLQLAQDTQVNRLTASVDMSSIGFDTSKSLQFIFDGVINVQFDGESTFTPIGVQGCCIVDGMHSPNYMGGIRFNLCMFDNSVSSREGLIVGTAYADITVNYNQYMASTITVDARISGNLYCVNENGTQKLTLDSNYTPRFGFVKALTMEVVDGKGTM